MTSKTPLVSICIPTCNSARFLRVMLDSVIAQTYSNVEVLISDNASTDETMAIAREYVAKYKFQLFQNRENIGAFNNFNRLVGLAHGEYVAIYHADDIYEPAIVDKCVRILDADPSIGLVGTMGRVIDKNGNRTADFRKHKTLRDSGPSVYSFDESYWGALMTGGESIFFITPSIMVRRALYAELGGFKVSEKYQSAADYEMWLRLARRYKTAVIDDRLMHYRIHENQGSEREIRTKNDVPDIIYVLNDYRQFISDAATRGRAGHVLEQMILATALRQNSLGLFDKSSATLDQFGIQTTTAALLRMINRLRIPVSSRLHHFLKRVGSALLSRYVRLAS